MYIMYILWIYKINIIFKSYDILLNWEFNLYFGVFKLKKILTIITSNLKYVFKQSQYLK